MIKDIAFQLDAGRTGILLIHGLTGTPNEMRSVAVGLHRAGFTVSAMQLAGHCGSEEDLLNTRWPDWYRSVCEAADKLRERVDHLFVAGLSMGGILALKLAAERPQAVDGVIVYGASFRYDGWSIPWSSRLLSRLLPLARPLRIGRHRCFMEQPPYGIRDERLREVVVSLMSSGDSTLAGLRGNPWHSLADMYALSAVVQRQLPHVTAPCLVIHASEDDVASVKNAHLIVERVRGPVELVLLHDSYHMVTIDRERAVVIERTAAFMKRVAAVSMQADPPAAGAAAALPSGALQPG
ncbi:alpha/beta hydrolase [Methylibium sp.]|uniref:alpha/beta hydrolase n=1 Tax=Methylibium sp. TaxID=2067992 RepID=UPI003D0BDFE6